MTVEEAKTYFQKLAQDAGLDETSTNAIVAGLGNEKFAKELVNGYKRQDEFSRSMDQVRTKETELTKWYNEQAVPAYQANLTGLQKLQEYEKRFGNLEEADPDKAVLPKDVLTRKEFEDLLKQRDQAYVNLTKTVSNVQMDYFKKFGETLDLNTLEKEALASGLPLETAYEKFIQPKMEERREADFKVRIQKEREEAAREALSKYKLPVDAKPRDFHPVFDRTDAPKGTSDLDQERTSRTAFLEAWNGVADGVADQHK
jgi:hypothetical protein